MSDHCSFSQLSLFLKHPYEVAGYMLDNRAAQKSTPAMIFGSMVDALYYEQSSQFFARPKDADGKELSANSNAYKAMKAELPEGASFIKSEDMAEAEDCVRSLHANELASRFRAGGECQKRISFDFAGTECVCVPDCTNFFGVSDLKTSNDISAREFSKAIYDRKYHVQAWLYCAAIKAATGHTPDFHWIVAQSSTPYAIRCYRAVPELLEAGAMDASIALLLWRDWKAGNRDKYSQTEPEDINLPAYAIKNRADFCY